MRILGEIDKLETMHLALIIPSGHFYNTPCIPNLAKYLAQQGCQVDIYVAQNQAVPGGELVHRNIRFYWFPIVQRHAKEKVALLSVGFFFWLAWRFIRQRYDYIIACGIRALFVVGLLSYLYRRQFIYNSLEIYSGDRFGTLRGRLFKRIESFFNRRAQFSVIQDYRRGEILRDVNNLDGQEILEFPNAPFQASSSMEVHDLAEIEHRVRTRFKISNKKRIIVYSGSLEAKWSGCQRILRVLPQLPRDWILFLQHRMKPDEPMPPELIDLTKEGRLFMSTTPLTSEDYDDLIAAADIGLAWYESEEDNIRYVGFSSGKIAHYFSHGKPVIVNSLPMYDEIFAKEGCGELVQDVVEIPAAVEAIAQNYAHYSEGARSVYERVYDMQGYTREIVAALKRNAWRSPEAFDRDIPE
jgi:glycosyltransferase involved in cell wall biosynthesis